MSRWRNCYAVAFPLVLGLLWLGMPAQAVAAPRIWLALSEEGRIYSETAAIVQAGLAQSAGAPQLSVGTWPQLLAQRGPPPDLVVTLGVGAFAALDHAQEAAAVGNTTAVLAALLPRASFAALAAQRAPRTPRAQSAVFIDPPVELLLDATVAALPEVRRVGVIAGPLTGAQLPALRGVARARGVSLVVATPLGDEHGVFSTLAIYPALKTLLDDADVVLALPEPGVYNAGSISNILLASYRARKPLVAFSAAYGAAGAVLSLYYTPEQVAHALVERISQWTRRGELGRAASPNEFSLSVNSRVADSLNLAIESETAIRKRLAERKVSP